MVKATKKKKKTNKQKSPGGKPLASGRKKGTPNRRTESLIDSLAARNFNPVEKLIAIHDLALKTFHDGGFDFDPAGGYLEIARKSVCDLMQYVYPKRKAIDLQLGAEEKETISDLVKALSK